MSRLLVIDNDPSVLHFVRRIFDHTDLTVLTASTSAEGLALAAKHAPDVVVLDIALPDVSGLETFLRIRELDSQAACDFQRGGRHKRFRHRSDEDRGLRLRAETAGAERHAGTGGARSTCAG